MKRYFKDSVGRILCEEDDLFDYVYGRAKILDKEELVQLDQVEGPLLFVKQQAEMWKAVERLLPMARSIAIKRFGRDVGELLLSEVGIPTLCYAAVRHDPTRALLKTYARGLLIREYTEHAQNIMKHSGGHEGVQVQGSFTSESTGLDDLDELYSLQLEPEELELLLARYGYGMSTRELAAKLGLKSPQSVLDRVNKVLNKCRQSRI